MQVPEPSSERVARAASGVWGSKPQRASGGGAPSGGCGRQRAPLVAFGLLMIVLLPSAHAAVAIDGMIVPDRTAAEKPFEVSVVLSNDGPARDVFLLGALYDKVDGKGPCGPSTDPRFRSFTHLVQERVRVPANGVLPYPAAGERWLHRYELGDVDPGAPYVAEFCVFVANASQGPLIEYESFSSSLLSVRAHNGVPSVSFVWDPARPVVGAPATFEASASDADGDPVSFSWDLGHFVASGRAVAEGARVEHAFYPEGEFVVTLVGTDGLDEARAVEIVRVGAAQQAEERSLVPLSASVALASMLIGSMAARRRR